MRNTTFAIYNGIEYSAGIKADGSIVLRSNNICDESKGFFEKRIGNNSVYIKYVQRNEVEEIYDKRFWATYKGYKFEVVDENAEQISIIIMVGDYSDWLQLGMKPIDKGVYQKWIDRDEAEIEIVKEPL
ncbi:hypothetical protein [Anaerosporobacter sp.]